MTNKPPEKPKLSREEAEEILKNYGVDNYPVKILGVRGYYKKSLGDPNANDRNLYDDALFVITPHYFSAYNANTDPSKFRKGIAVLKTGVHLYRKGKHGLSKPGGGYNALRPATKGEKLPVIRDEVGDSEGIAINIHKGSYSTTSSEGCQTIYPDQWLPFINKVYEQMDKHNQNVIPYILVEL